LVKKGEKNKGAAWVASNFLRKHWITLMGEIHGENLGEKGLERGAVSQTKSSVSFLEL